MPPRAAGPTAIMAPRTDTCLPGLTAVGRYSDGQTLLHDRNQSGVNTGGPILSGKLFFFANFEVLNDHYDGLNRITNQLIADPTASIVAPSNCKATASACAAAEKFIQSQMNVLVPLSQRSIDGIDPIDYRSTCEIQSTSRAI